MICNHFFKPLVKNFNDIRYVSQRNMSFMLQYKEHGDPPKVIEKVDIDPKSLIPNDNQVLVKMLAAPVNPADINMIQGTYALTPPLPAIGGNEGVGKVMKVGSQVTKIRQDSWVIPKSAGVGTWRTDWVCGESDVMEIPGDLSLDSAATISVNPCTAYRMLQDFVPLRPGDTVIQNGANSGVGQAVIQLARHFGLRTINVIRTRPDLDQFVARLKSLGADFVITEEELRAPVMKEIFSKVPLPKLALNCVGGKNATDLFRHLAPNGYMVTYGGMSKQPVTVPTGVLIFKNIHVRGFWMTEWSKQHMDHPGRKKMLDTLFEMARRGALKPPSCSLIPFPNYKEALQRAMQPFVAHKQILVMDENFLKK